MPKVSEDYFKKKRDEILDAAYQVVMEKPIYSVSLRDIIQKSGLSQGGIYRYYSGLDDILIALINRECPACDMEQEVNAILSLELVPEQTLEQLFRLWQNEVLKNYVGAGKIYFEVTNMYANDLERLEHFRSENRLGAQETNFQEKCFGWLAEKIQAGYFQPKTSIEDLLLFMGTAFDGMIRDLILARHYKIGEAYENAMQLDPDKLVTTLYLSTVLLLSGDVSKRKNGGLSNEK